MLFFENVDVAEDIIGLNHVLCRFLITF